MDEKKHLAFIIYKKKNPDFFPSRNRSKIINQKESQRWKVGKFRAATTKLPNTKHINHHYRSQKQVLPTPTLCIPAVKQAKIS